MRKRYIVLVDNPTAEETAAITNLFRGPNYGWWHWIKGVWLVVCMDDTQTSETICNSARLVSGNKTVLVFDIQGGGQWAGFGPNQGEKNMFPWLQDHWK